MGNNDYLALGDWNAACSMCGRKRKASSMVRNWQGQYRCPTCNETRHPQDFVRGKVDEQSVPWAQPETDIDVVFCDFNSQCAIPGFSTPGCMMPGRTEHFLT